VTGRRGRRRKQLPNGFKETRRYWKLKEEALDRTLLGKCPRTCCKAKYVIVVIIIIIIIIIIETLSLTSAFLYLLTLGLMDKGSHCSLSLEILREVVRN
jgi:hypothetical protein